ncbi:MAG: hypothetical protein M3Y37_10010 [Chloroflexota bacterium]|nr:hypothetical protein [Chloroflexota bacterium]
MDNTVHVGGYAPAGEESGVGATFSLEEIAAAFEVDPERVHRAMTGEFGNDRMRVDSRQAQHLADVLLGDQPQDRQMAALIRLGAYTPRPDHAEGLGEKDPADESDKLEGHINEVERDHDRG